MRKRPPMPNGLILWEGISQLDGETPIVVIATGIRLPSANRKTGPMVQTWILRRDIAPHAAQQAGLDTAVCPAECSQRPANGGSCYVNTGQGPLAIWIAYKAGRYPYATELQLDELGAIHRIRAGAYGDPAAAPLWLWVLLRPHTGYTHAWKRPEVRDYQQVVMASVDNAAEADAAQQDGWRTFRVTLPGDDANGREIECLSETHGTSCHDCGLCAGGQLPKAPHIRIEVHGAFASRFIRRALPISAA